MESWLIPPDPVEPEIVYMCNVCREEFDFDNIFYIPFFEINICKTCSDSVIKLQPPINGYPKPTDILGL